MWAPALAQMDNRTHCPSWSHAPSVWGSLKSPATIGPSTADTIWANRIDEGILAST